MAKKQKRQNIAISWGLGLITAYVLLVNNSLEFLRNFGINVQENVIGVIMIFVTIGFIGYKYGKGDI